MSKLVNLIKLRLADRLHSRSPFMRQSYYSLALSLFAMMSMLLTVATAHADQTDKRLDELFGELRTGGAINAEENANRILELWADSQSDTVDVLYQRALMMYHDGKYKQAGLLLAYIRGLSPNFMQAYALNGFVKLSIDDRPGALNDFSKALELEPRQFEVRKALVQMLLNADEKRAAYDMIQKALEWNPHDENLRAQARKLRIEFDGQDI